MIRDRWIEGILDDDPVTIEFFGNPLKQLEHCRKHVLIDPIPGLDAENMDKRNAYREKVQSVQGAPPGCLSDRYTNLCSTCQQADCCLEILAPLIGLYMKHVHRQFMADAAPARPAMHGYNMSEGSVAFACSNGLFAEMYPKNSRPPTGRTSYQLATAFCPSPQVPGNLGVMAQALVDAGRSDQGALTQLALEDRYLAAVDKLGKRAVEPFHFGALREG